jgi:gluconolactonase
VKRALLLLLAAFLAYADEDWDGRFSLVPVSAPEMALEAVAPRIAHGSIVSIGVPTNAENQVWVLERVNDAYALRTATNPTLVLAAKDGGTRNGTQMVLEADTAKPWQRWTITTHARGSISLLAVHAPDKGLDDFRGSAEPGARQDLWDYRPGDEHLHWMLKPLAGATQPAEFAERARLAAHTKRGVIKEFSFADSRIFPGTRRSGHIFIPAQYDASKSACVYVRQDGFNRAEKDFLETLITAGDIPVTVGVFVRPGQLAAPMPGTLGRRNRCFEYDAVGDDYVRFLTEELLPFVAREFELNLSTSGNDRCIAGGSSGGIAAFNAAWQRPDAFSRVYANSGSFVAFRGGHEFPALVRKVEAKPIRAYLTTGMRDMTNAAGDWYLLDQEMDKSLAFSGYDYFFRAIDGGHVAGWNEFFPEAMRFIWKDWPEPVKAGSSSPRARDVLIPGEAWTLAAEGFQDARGPSTAANGDVLFADSASQRIYRLGTDGKTRIFAKDSGGANAVSVGPKGAVYSVSESTGTVLRYTGETRTELAADIPGRHLLARPDGSLYISGADKVWHLKDGKTTIVDSGLKRAGGLAYRPDQWLLAVADGASKWAYSYQINDVGNLIHKERFFWLHVRDGDDDTGAESICYAKEGQLFVATRYGIQICADDGPSQVILPMPDRSRVRGVCLGGADGNILFAFCGDKIWQRKVKVHGIGAYSPWFAVRGTPL